MKTTMISFEQMCGLLAKMNSPDLSMVGAMTVYQGFISSHAAHVILITNALDGSAVLITEDEEPAICLADVELPMDISGGEIAAIGDHIDPAVGAQMEAVDRDLKAAGL